MMQQWLGWGAMAWGLGTMPATWAHGVDIQYQVVPSYHITATYDGGQPMAEAQVSIFAPNQPAQPWLQGKTNAQGQFTFIPSQGGDWAVRIRQAGHGQFLVIPVTMGQINPKPGQDVLAKSVNQSGPQPLHWSQRGLILGSVVWGCIGTALFFSRSRRESADHAST
ncbi:carboxypeptidase regulatory-like domain-containing protein [Synechocystis sp. LKSZ1]